MSRAGHTLSASATQNSCVLMSYCRKDLHAFWWRVQGSKVQGRAACESGWNRRLEEVRVTIKVLRSGRNSGRKDRVELQTRSRRSSSWVVTPKESRGDYYFFRLCTESARLDSVHIQSHPAAVAAPLSHSKRCSEERQAEIPVPKAHASTACSIWG